MIRRFLCWLGLHRWQCGGTIEYYNGASQRRQCLDCCIIKERIIVRNHIKEG